MRERAAGRRRSLRSPSAVVACAPLRSGDVLRLEAARADPVGRLVDRRPVARREGDPLTAAVVVAPAPGATKPERGRRAHSGSVHPEDEGKPQEILIILPPPGRGDGPADVRASNIRRRARRRRAPRRTRDTRGARSTRSRRRVRHRRAGSRGRCRRARFASHRRGSMRAARTGAGGECAARGRRRAPRPTRPARRDGSRRSSVPMRAEGSAAGGTEQRSCECHFRGRTAWLRENLQRRDSRTRNAPR
jgi:hypothetical protein